jgi:hypothetical protein
MEICLAGSGFQKDLLGSSESLLDMWARRRLGVDFGEEDDDGDGYRELAVSARTVSMFFNWQNVAEESGNNHLTHFTIDRANT